MPTGLTSNNEEDIQADLRFVEWNQTGREYPQHICFHQYFEIQVVQTPDAVAIVFHDLQLSYRALDQYANQVAHSLQAMSVGPDVVVGVYMERSLEFVIGLLAVLKAGGAYVPLDPTYPAERIAFMLADTQSPVLLTQHHLTATLPPYPGHVLCIDSDWETIRQQETCSPESPVVSDHLAYVIYTSGSTGQPKGVQITHNSLLNLVSWFQYAHKTGPTDRMSQMGSVSFDACVWEIWATLGAGACLHLPAKHVLLSLFEIQRWLIEQQITLCFLPTPLGEELFALPWQAEYSVRILFVGGDKLRVVPTQMLPCTLINAYGPTESTVIATTALVPTGTSTSPAIGRPIANTVTYLLDAALHPVPVGADGEIYIGGAGLARGYLHRPALTAERFIPSPFSTEPGARLYRTGDLARYRADGQLEYIGRLDQQVKLRGFRIELGEIEATLCAHPAVREAVVVALEEMGEKRLVAYVIPASEPPPIPHELRAFVEARLPVYMVPAAFVPLEAFPRSANGKLDRRALPLPAWDTIERARAYIAPQTPTEIKLAELWAGVLPVKHIGREDNFFLLGADSLLALRMLSRVRSTFYREVPLAVFFTKATLATLAEYLDQAEQDGGHYAEPDVLPLQPQRRETSETGEMFVPLSFAQQRLWLLDQLEPGNPSYTILTVLRLHGQLAMQAFEESFNILLQRHEILRTTCIVWQGQPCQRIVPHMTIALSVIDITQSTQNQHIALEAAHTFNLASGPLLRVTLLHLHETEHILLINMHHIISDGWSIGVLIEELGQLYTACVQGRNTNRAYMLPALPIQYADYTLLQREWLQRHGEGQETLLTRQQAYWKQQLAAAPALLELPTDYPRPAVQTYRGATESLLLDPELVRGLQAVGQQSDQGNGGHTLFMTLLAVFQLLLSRYVGEEDIVVGTPFANRNHTELEGLIGFFMNTLALRVNLSGNPPFNQFLQRVRMICIEAYMYQDIPFEQVIEALRPERTLSHNPLFQVFFNLLSMGNYPTHPLVWPALDVEVLWPGEEGAKFDLTLYAREMDNGIRLEATYNADLFLAARMRELLEQMRYLLTQVIAQPARRLAQFSLVTPTAATLLPDPRKPLLARWEGSIPTLFSGHAERSPDRLAVVDGEDAWSYRTLNEYSNQLANYLCAHDIHSQDVVAIYAHRSAALVCAVMGILKTGAAYVILDPAYPTPHLITYLELAQVSGFVSLEAAGPLPVLLQQAVTTSAPACQVTLYRQAGQRHDPVRTFSTIAPTRDIGPHDLACIAFTSGATGQPKGVLQEHGALTHFLPWMQDTFAITEQDHYSMLSGLAHDPLQRDIFTPLCLGATLYIPSPADILTPGWLATWMQQVCISVTNLTPAMLRVLTQTVSPLQQIPSLHYAFIVGDLLTRFDSSLLQQVAPAITCVNLYGTTEAQRAMGYFIITPAGPEDGQAEHAPNERIPLGRGIANTQLLILRDTQELAGIGEVGEIYIRSPHLARGYLHNARLTEERFMLNPFTQKADDRLYRTGDMGRYLPDGNVDYSGRNDRQMKIRGFRIEAGEVEVSLRHHPAVREAVVVAWEDTPGDKRLIAYVVPSPEHKNQTLLQHALREFLQTRLPGYMLPAAFVVLETLPLLPTSKIDFKALPAPTFVSSGTQHGDMPRTHTEEVLAGLWQNLLRMPHVGIHEDFFALGGHSLLATQLLARILATFHITLPLRTLFEFPTIARLAPVIEQHSAHSRLHDQSAQAPIARRTRRIGPPSSL